ncbi:hypothetical protein NIES4075_46970 [Tolypothrix sp. NIES-4075]|uniref:hypothetical protein n=1 Tax=Tolypothrix sp. NIES-4075 TaxID=2005459 RepID=UPI000B6C8B3D|nr:hypothetical protein [Tolypothrix sp. NIES-4075]GAX43682.1 hypothetical protein NIES4075_46970 [Tolypothrix sp. NIES-4075]
MGSQCGGRVPQATAQPRHGDAWTLGLEKELLPITITDYPLPITHSPFPIPRSESITIHEVNCISYSVAA